MGDIHVFPGTACPELVADLPADTLLKNACDKGLIDVVVVGRGPDGGVRVWGTTSDVDRSIGLLTRGISFLASGQQVTLDSEVDGPA